MSMKVFRFRSIEHMVWKSQKGFTLAELLVAITLSLAVLGAVRAVYRVQAHTVKAQEYRMEAQEYARAALDMMVRETRNLGYFPNRTPCAAPANTKGIVAASAQSIHFVYDADGNNDCAGAGEEITYSYDATALDISRTQNGGAAQTLTDGNVTTFQFVYYPKQTVGTLPPPYCYAAAGDLVVNGVTCSGIVTANLANIQRVSISLTVQSKSTDTQFGGQQTITMDSNANLRNRGL